MKNKKLVETKMDNFDKTYEGFKIGDKVKWRKPTFKSEIGDILIIKKIHTEYGMLGLGKEDSTYSAICYPKDVIKLIKVVVE